MIFIPANDIGMPAINRENAIGFVSRYLLNVKLYFRVAKLKQEVALFGVCGLDLLFPLFFFFSVCVNIVSL